MGICTIGPFALAMSLSFMNASEAPKSTVPASIWAIPPPDPIDWYATWTPVLPLYVAAHTDIIGLMKVEPAPLSCLAPPDTWATPLAKPGLGGVPWQTELPLPAVAPPVPVELLPQALTARATRTPSALTREICDSTKIPPCRPPSLCRVRCLAWL